ncbi:MAG: hypothetical protein HY753_07885 [Nitrospirae bacterium]|nr:hypothetical protein [Nitrospirota bacterium]
MENAADGTVWQPAALAGLVIDKQTSGTNNYGIILNGDGAGADLVMGADRETKLYGSDGDFVIDTTGNVGIGTTAPVEKLEVAGAIKVAGAASSSCTSSNEGTIKYVSSHFMGCTSSGWVQLDN